MREIPVDVISVCSAGGELRPLRLRVEDEEQCLQRIDILEVVRKKTVPYIGAEAELFLCRASISGKSRLIRLRYDVRGHCWHIIHNQHL